MAAPTVRTDANPIRTAVALVHKRRGRLHNAAAPVTATPLDDQTGTVAATKTIAVPLANYTRATSIYAASADGGALPAWLTQDYASNTLTLSKSAAAGVVGVYPLCIVAQTTAGLTIRDHFKLTLTS
jgi:hypothetical protein